MCESSVDNPKAAIAARLASAARLLVVTHARPDGDALGSMAALVGAARAAGKAASMLLPDDGEVPQRCAFVLAGDRPAGPGELAALADEADVVVVVDTCALAQLDGLGEALASRRDKIVAVDHHATADAIASVHWQDISACATGVMVGELIDSLGWPVTRAVGEALFVAVATDTGWFRFSNTDGRCLRAAGRLVDAGVCPDVLYRRLYQADRPERLALLQRALASLAVPVLRGG